MLEKIKHSIIESKAEIREQFKVEIKGILVLMHEEISTKTVIWIYW